MSSNDAERETLLQGGDISGLPGPYDLMATGVAQAQGLFVISAVLAGRISTSRSAVPRCGLDDSFGFSNNECLWSAGCGGANPHTQCVAALEGAFQYFDLAGRLIAFIFECLEDLGKSTDPTLRQRLPGIHQWFVIGDPGLCLSKFLCRGANCHDARDHSIIGIPDGAYDLFSVQEHRALRCLSHRV